MIYYGQERGVTEQRGTMRWHDGDADLTAFHRSLSTLRDTHPCSGEGGRNPRTRRRERSRHRLRTRRRWRDAPRPPELRRRTVRRGPDRAIEPTDCRTGESVDATDGIEVRDIVVLRTAD